MAVPTNTVKHYSAVGMREDLSDIVINIAPTETPFYSACKTKKASSTKHEWLTYDIRAAADNAHVQGDDTTATAHVPRVRLSNNTQIFKEAATVSGTAQSGDYAGPRAMMADEVFKKLRAVKLDIELALFANTAKVTAADGVAGRMAGLPTWIKTNVVAGVGGTNPAGDGSNTRGAGTSASFTEANLKTLLQSMWNVGANPSKVYLPGSLLTAATAFTGMAPRQEMKDVGKVSAMIDVYITNFGKVTFEPSRMTRATDVIVVDPEHCYVANYRPFKQEPLAKTGDAERVQIVGELTFAPGTEKAFGIAADRIP